MTSQTRDETLGGERPFAEKWVTGTAQARAAYARGYIAGVAELDTIHRTGTDPENQDA